MKLIKSITDLNKAIINEKNLGFVPTMGSIHKGHEFLIKEWQKKSPYTSQHNFPIHKGTVHLFGMFTNAK